MLLGDWHDWEEVARDGAKDWHWRRVEKKHRRGGPCVEYDDFCRPFASSHFVYFDLPEEHLQQRIGIPVTVDYSWN